MLLTNIGVFFCSFPQDLQTDIHNHRTVVQSLNTTGGIIVHGNQPAGVADADSLETQLKEMNERWSRVNERSTELRSVKFNHIIIIITVYRSIFFMTSRAMRQSKGNTRNDETHLYGLVPRVQVLSDVLWLEILFLTPTLPIILEFIAVEMAHNVE